MTAEKKWAVAHMHVHAGEVEVNLKTIKSHIDWAVSVGADCLVLPELCVSGYAVGDQFFATSFREKVLSADAQIANMSTQIDIVWGSFTPAPNGKLHNVAHVATGGKLTTSVKKTLLPMDFEFDEARWFAPNEAPCKAVLVAGLQVGILICKDISDEKETRKPCEELAADGAQVLIHIGAETFFIGKSEQQNAAYASAKSRTNLPLVSCRAFGSISLSKSVHLLRGKAHHDDTKPETALWAINQMVGDFWVRNGLGKAVIGLSGGIDSAVTLCIMAQALGAENALAVHMPTEFTSKRATSDAKTLCEVLGVELRIVPIEPIVEAFQQVVSELKPGNLTHQNLQARVRGGGVLSLIASQIGGAHVATGNRTEATFGYTTLYGDMTGALAPIGDCTKADVYGLADLFEAIPKTTKTAQPSAELAFGQSDPFYYPYHDQLALAFTQQFLTPADIIQKWENGTLADDFGLSQNEIEQLFSAKSVFEADLHQNWNRFTGSAFKRAQAPPVIAVRRGTFGIALRESF